MKNPVRFVVTEEEQYAYAERNYVLDEETGEILGERLSPWRAALLEGDTWPNETGFPDDVILEIPDDFLYPNGKESIGR